MTPRLRLRPWRETDRAAMAVINRDPQVQRYLGAATDDAAIDGFVDRTVAHWHEHGFGHYAVESREPGRTGTLLGFIGLAYPTFVPEVADRPELGWRLASTAWGQGLATEGATAVRERLVRGLGFSDFISLIHPENLGSRRVAEKLGMVVERTVTHPVTGVEVEVEVWAPPTG
jgi:RimJ/RimL family protein N-acetyltransferase